MRTVLTALAEQYVAAVAATSKRQGNQTVADLSADPLLQALATLHLEWQESRADVWDAYADWCDAPASRRTEARDGYLDVLAREETAADSYRAVVERVIAVVERDS